MGKPATITIAAEAEGDLQAIYNRRLSQRGPHGPDGADALLDDIFTAIVGLSEFPQRGPIPPELEAIGMAGWRQISVRPYRIIYSHTGKTITVAVIADSRRDFTWLLEQRLLRSPLRG